MIKLRKQINKKKKRREDIYKFNNDVYTEIILLTTQDIS